MGFLGYKNDQKCHNIDFFLLKNSVGLIKACLNIMNFYFSNSMNFNAEFKKL